MRRTLIATVLLLSATRVHAADLAVPGTYATIQAAVNAAASGDRVMIAPGTYNECVTLPNKGTLGSPIIIRSSTADGNLPGATVRLANTDGSAPTDYAAVLPLIKAPNNGCGTFNTAAGARDYQIGPGLKIQSSTYRPSIELGANDSSQQTEADQPKNITVDRVWLTGDQWLGQKVGIDMNGQALTIKNSFIDNIKGVAQDAVGVRCFNGTGPLTIYNNYISATGYHYICGGDQPWMMQFADVNAGATTTQATLSSITLRSGAAGNISSLRVGQYITFLAGGGTVRYHPKVLSCGTKKVTGEICDGATITYEAIPAAPDTGAGAASEAQWGALPTGQTIRRNYFYKDPAWMNNILSTPVISSTTPSTASGSLAAGTYFYRVQATYCCYQGARVYSSAATEVSATLSATGKVTLNWGAVTGPSFMVYRVFRSTTAGTYAGYIDVGNVTSYVDTGTALTGTSTPASGTKWVMKNVFEIKFGIDVQIDSNIFKHSPVGVESGYAVWFKSNNYGGGFYMHTRNVTFEKNVMDGMDGCFSVLGRIDTTPDKLTRPLENLTIRNNICFDSNTAWMMGKAGPYAIKIQSPVNGLIIENNTFIHTMSGYMYLDRTTTAGSIPTASNFSHRNNIYRKVSYAVFSDACSSANNTECFTEFVTGTSPFVGNVVGGSGFTQPAGNLLVPLTEFEGTSHFVSYPAGGAGGVIGDFALKPTSSWKGTASGGGDPGANIALLTSATTGVLTGAAEGTNAPDITTTTLANVTQGAAMTPVTFGVSGGTPTYSWTVAPGSSLPPGLSFSSGGVLSGTPTTAGTYTFSVKVTDSTAGTALTDTQALQLIVVPASATLIITTTTLDAVQLSQPISKQIVATGGTPPYVFTVDTGSTLPNWLTLSPSGLLEGVPTATGTSNFTLRVDDAVGGNDTQALSQVVTAETNACPAAPAGRDRRQFFIFNGIMVARASFRGPTAPSTSFPECARKDDTWFDTSTNTRKIAKLDASGALVWGPDPADPGLVNPVELDTNAPPVDGSIILGTSSGGWTIAQGIDGSAIISGTIDPDRLGSLAAQPLTVTMLAGTQQSVNIAAGGEEFGDGQRFRTRVDTENFTWVAFSATFTGVCAPSGTVLKLQYSTDNSTFTDIPGTEIDCDSSPGARFAPGSFVSLPAGARAPDTYFRAFFSDGDGAVDPTFTNIFLNFRP